MNDSKKSYDKGLFTKALTPEGIKKREQKKLRKRRINQLKTQRLIVDFLKFNFISKRKDIVKGINIPRTTIYDNLMILKRLKIVDSVAVKLSEGKGRSYTLWYLTSEMREITNILGKLDLNGVDKLE